MTKILEDIMKLEEAERLEIAEAILASLGRQNVEFHLSTEQETMLNQRLAAAKSNPSEGIAWEDVKARVRSKK